MTARPPLAVASATIGRRVGAYAIDIAIAYGSWSRWPASSRSASCSAVGAAADPATSPAGRGPRLGCPPPAGMLGWAIVYTAMQGGKGSIGQRTLRLRLHDADDRDAGRVRRALLRNIVWFLGIAIVVGYFTPLFDRAAAPGLARQAGARDRRRPPGRARRGSGRAPPRRSRRRRPRPPRMPCRSSRLPPPRFPSAAGAGSAAPRAREAADRHDLARPRRHAGPASSSRSPRRRHRAASRRSPCVPSAGRAAPDPAGPARHAPAAPARRRRRHPRRGIRPAPAQRAALYADAPVIAVLTWDDGTRMAVYGRTVYGRNPAAEAGSRQRRRCATRRCRSRRPTSRSAATRRARGSSTALHERHRTSSATAGAHAGAAGCPTAAARRATGSSSATAAPSWAAAS